MKQVIIQQKKFNCLNKNFFPNVGYTKIPMITPADFHNTNYGPLKGIFDYVSQIENQPGVLSASVFTVQPWLDIPEMGWAAIVYSYKNSNNAKILSKKIADLCWSLRKKFFLKHTPPEIFLKEASNLKGLMVVSDSDSTSSGGTGDNTIILEKMLKENIKYPALLTIVDSHVVKKAIKAGIGNKIFCKLGAKKDIFSKPVYVEAIIKSISDGKFFIEGHCGNLEINMGKTVVLQTGYITILVSTRIGYVFEQNIFKSVGLDPKNFRIVVVKSPVGFRTAYEPIAENIVLSDSPGITSANLQSFNWKNINRPIFPLDNINN